MTNQIRWFCCCVLICTYLLFSKTILAAPADQDFPLQLPDPEPSIRGGVVPETIYHLVQHGGAVGNGTCDDTEVNFKKNCFVTYTTFTNTIITEKNRHKLYLFLKNDYTPTIYPSDPIQNFHN